MTIEKKKHTLIGFTFVAFWVFRVLFKTSLDITGKFGGAFNPANVISLVFVILTPIFIISLFFRENSLSYEEKLPFLIWILIDPYLYMNAVGFTSSFAVLLTVVCFALLKDGRKSSLPIAYVSLILISVFYPVAVFSFIPLICISIYVTCKKSFAYRVVLGFAVPVAVFAIVSVLVGIITSSHLKLLEFMKDFGIYRITDIINLYNFRYVIYKLVIFAVLIILYGLICKKFFSDKLELTDYIVIFVPLVLSFIAFAINSTGIVLADTAVFSGLLMLSFYRNKKIGTAVYYFFKEHRILLLILLLVTAYMLADGYGSEFLSKISASFM